MTHWPPDPPVPVTVEFQTCEYAWICFRVSAGSQSVLVSASGVFDPFQDLIAWLEAVAVGVQECAFSLDEEGHLLEFRLRYDYPNTMLSLSEEGGETPYLRVAVDRCQLVKAFYESLTAFSLSDRYVPAHWEREELGENLLNELGEGWSRERLIEILERFDGAQLRCFLLAVDPNYGVRTTIPAHAITQYLMNPDAAKNVPHQKGDKNSWNIETKYNTLTGQERRDFIGECLDEQVSAYEGYPLRKLRSGVLEAKILSLSEQNPDHGARS